MILPNFLIIGAAKAGTTSLYHYIKRHPDIYMSPIKEINYFAYRPNGDLYGRDIRFPVRTANDYRRLFDDVATELAIGEVSPLYLEYPGVAKRIHHSLPKARLIAVLREPIERALSAYSMRRRKGQEHEKVEDVILPSSHYVQNGLYCARLKPYFELFPREQIHVLLFDDLKQDPRSVVQSIFRFIGVDDEYEPNTQRRHNVGGLPKSMMLNQVLYNQQLQFWLRPIVPRRIRVFLRNIWRHNLTLTPDLAHMVSESTLELFQQDIDDLQKLIDRDLSVWLKRYCSPNTDA